jgi:hypothetical protein
MFPHTHPGTEPPPPPSDFVENPTFDRLLPRHPGGASKRPSVAAGYVRLWTRRASMWMYRLITKLRQLHKYLIPDTFRRAMSATFMTKSSHFGLSPKQ